MHVVPNCKIQPQSMKVANLGRHCLSMNHPDGFKFQIKIDGLAESPSNSKGHLYSQ